MNIRKLLALLVSGAVILSFAGCSSNNGSSVSDSSASETTSAPAQTTLVPDNSNDEFVSGYPAFAVTSNSLTGNFWSDITSNTTRGKNASPDLSWEPVEGASCYAIYMVDLSTHYFLHWVQGDIKETSLPQGFAGSKYYIGMYPPAGDTHVYNVYVFALKNPVERVKGSVNAISPKFPDFIKALDTDKDGNTGNIISVGKVSAKFTG